MAFLYLRDGIFFVFRWHFCLLRDGTFFDHGIFFFLFCFHVALFCSWHFYLEDGSFKVFTMAFFIFVVHTFFLNHTHCIFYKIREMAFFIK